MAPWIAKGVLRPDALLLLDRYAAILYNRVPSLSLIAKGDRETIYTRHILDSLGPLAHFDAAPEWVLDIGSGGGLPGIPLGIVWAESRVVLLESREKKAAFLESAVRALGLGRRLRVVCERLEEHAKKTAPTYEALFVRAVADPSRLIELIAPSCLPGARWFYFLGAGADRKALASDFAATGREVAEVPGTLGGRLLTGAV